MTFGVRKTILKFGTSKNAQLIFLGGRPLTSGESHSSKESLKGLKKSHQRFFFWGGGGGQTDHFGAHDLSTSPGSASDTEKNMLDFCHAIICR